MPDYSTAALFVRSCLKLDLPLPERVVTAHARHAALQAAHRDLGKQRKAAIAEMAAALTAAGTDADNLAATLTGRAATRLAALEAPGTADALMAATYTAEVELRRAIVDAGDDVIVGWRPTVEQARADLTAAVAAMPDVEDLADHEAVVLAGADAAEWWARATRAIGILTKIGQQLDAMNALGYDLTPTGALVNASVARLAVLSWQHVEERTAGRLWSAVRHGAQIRLHTSAELHEMIAGIKVEHLRNLTPIERSLRTDPRAMPSWSTGSPDAA